MQHGRLRQQQRVVPGGGFGADMRWMAAEEVVSAYQQHALTLHAAAAV